MAKKVMILEDEEFKSLESIQSHIFGLILDLEFILDNTNDTKTEDDEESFDMTYVREKLIEHINDLYKVDSTLTAILTGTFDISKHQLSKYDLSK